MRLRLVSGHYIGWHAETRDGWSAGEEREVSAECGAYLTETFPSRFDVIASVAVVVGAPPSDRAMHSPRRRG